MHFFYEVSEMSEREMGRYQKRGVEPHAGKAPGSYVMISLVQGLFYLFTGIWPLVSLGTFMKVTGPKVDGWLVKTVGVIITVIGAVLMLAGYRRRWTPEVPLLAAGSAAGLTAIDVVYVARNRISPIYLVDAVVEVALILAWLKAWQDHTRQ